MNKRKLLQQILNHPKNVRFGDFIIIVEAFGFSCARVDRSHNIYKNMKVAEIINLQSVNGEAKPYQIKQFFALVEKYNLEMEEKD